jgi:hypothetical protein
MSTARQGSIHLFRFAGVDLFLHWSWFLVAVIEIQSRAGSYSSVTWNVLEYLALFLIVMLHEFGHALACRQVGGRANQIVLWPLGGVAYVDPPPRPGATLWSIAAGPLVNVALSPVLAALFCRPVARMGGNIRRTSTASDRRPMDQRSALGVQHPSHLSSGRRPNPALFALVCHGTRPKLDGSDRPGVESALPAFIGLAFWKGSIWYGALAVFMLMNCWGGFKHAQALLRIAKLPRRDGLSCPTCKTAPPAGTYWKCGHCGQPFDTFASGAVCPNCRTQFPSTQCLDCGRQAPLSEWMAPTLVAPGR